MSHNVTVKTQFKNEEALIAACKAQNLNYRNGNHTVQLYSGAKVADFSIQLPGWKFPIAINLKTGEAVYDNYNGSWGKIEQFDAIHQEYSLQVAEREPDVQEYLRQGWQAMREQQTDGRIDLVLLKH